LYTIACASLKVLSAVIAVDLSYSIHPTTYVDAMTLSKRKLEQTTPSTLMQIAVDVELVRFEKNLLQIGFFGANDARTRIELRDVSSRLSFGTATKLRWLLNSAVRKLLGFLLQRIVINSLSAQNNERGSRQDWICR